jgi:hypothetical protein
MKKPLTTLRLLVPMLATLEGAVAGGDQALTSFSANFNHGGGDVGDRSVRDYNWLVVVGQSATRIDSPSPDGRRISVGVSGAPAVLAPPGRNTAAEPPPTGPGFLFVTPPQNTMPRVMLLHSVHQGVSDSIQHGPQPDWLRSGTRKLAGLTVGEIDEISVHTKAASIHTVMRFALRVDGEWYASKSFFKQTDTGIFEKRTINPSVNEWISGVYPSETSLDIDLSENPSTPLNSSGVISGYGWFADSYSLAGKNASLQIDKFRIKLGLLSDPYLQWAIGPFANPLTDTGHEADVDNDGFSNLMEFVMGTDPTASDHPAALPVFSKQGKDLIVRFRRSDASELQPVVIKVEWGDHPDSAIVIGPSGREFPNGASYVVNETGTLDTVVVTIPGSAGALENVRISAAME